MTFPPKSKPWSQRPMDHNGGDQTSQWMDWITTQVNQLVGQQNAPVNTGLTSLVTNTVDPTSSQLATGGSRTSSITSIITAVPSATSIQLFWDGSNSSQVFQIFRDDGSTYGPNVSGSGLNVTGLVANTKYFFYPYFDETIPAGVPVNFVTIPGTSQGFPAIAFPAKSAKAAQQTILRNRIPLSIVFATTGVTTPASGTGAPVSGGNGGGSSGGQAGDLL